MIITETGILVSTDPNMRDPAPLNFKIEGGQVGNNSVRATGLTADTTYYAQSYFVKDGIYIRQKGVTEFKTASQAEVLKIKNAYAGSNTIGINNTSASGNITLDYSTDLGETWSTWSSTNGNFSVNLPQDGEVWLKGNNDRFGFGSGSHFQFVSTQIFDCEGNLRALLRNDITVLPDWCFYRLFYSSNIRTAPDLPADVDLSPSCYNQTFSNCTVLTSAPILPYTKLYPYCYQQIFYYCTSLAQAPALPATTLANGCYAGMFYGCTSLTQAPALPATTLAQNCYTGMFNGCTSLTQAPALPATTLASYCYQQMFCYCNSLTQAPALPATTLAQNCYDGMFSGCTSLTQAPALPATTLAQNCYDGMFSGCTSLTQAPALPATTLAQNCYNRMFQGCTVLNRIICYATNWNTSYANNWVNSVAGSGDFYNLGGATIPIDSVNGVPIGWTVHTYLGDPIRFTNTASETNTISLIRFNIPDITLEYSTDGINWTTNGPTDGAVNVTLQPSEYVMFRGINGNFNTESRYIHFTSTAACEVSGDINTLLNKVGGDIQLTPNPTFYKLFAGMTYLENGGLVLPSTTAGNGCYSNMFEGCTSLTQAPALPATTLAVYCYDQMFSGCTSLTQAPALPATVLTRSCYYGMFQGCTALVNAPALPATTLAQNCYYGMFFGCTSLETAPTLPASTLAQECYAAMFRNCSSLNNIKVYATTWNTSYTNYWVDGVPATGDFYNLGGATIPTGIAGIPSGWTVHTSL